MIRRERVIGYMDNCRKRGKLNCRGIEEDLDGMVCLRDVLGMFVGD